MCLQTQEQCLAYAKYTVNICLMEETWVMISGLEKLILVLLRMLEVVLRLINKLQISPEMSVE